MRTLSFELLQHLEGLRRRHLVDEVQADQELGLAGRQRPDRVRFPHLVEQRACHGNVLLAVPILPHRALCSPVKRSGRNGKLRLHDRHAALLPALGDACWRWRARARCGRRAPAAHHLLGGEPANPAAGGALRHQALRARRARRAPHRRRRGGAARVRASCGARPRPPSGQLAELAGRPATTPAAGGQRLSRQGAPGPGAARPARRGAAGALRDRHHPLARQRPPGGQRRRRSRGGHGPGDAARARGAGTSSTSPSSG